ncbi:MAG TPA: UDP-N-acetylmuramoyl-tripeptide--D-alanyl-D-alanine ligase [Rhizomicrobium sp.]|jgi:UDP-N-acetylmuramoyl-tripeptide--D-alanyl-D-alanine ligase|nr:UDP-N-acetylmuramoyl-tripeptide--D-alanyl-D-alanine ligase [Rhizomicrobium sp.]
MSLWTHHEAEAATLGQASQAFRVDGLSIDTRTLKEGDLFVALKGDNRDGHDFVRAAFDAKAGAALVSHAPGGGFDDSWGPLLTVGHTQRGLEDLARAARVRSNAKILAVTGSAGKTTTKEILAVACNALGRTHASAASHNNHWGVPLSLAALPRDAEFGIFEIGMNHFGEIRNLVSFVRPHVAMITTIAPAHLEFFGNCDSIADAKSEIFEGLLPGGAALVPADSPYAERLKSRARQAQVSSIIGFGITGESRLLSFAPDGDGMRVKADILGRAVDCFVGAPGAHIAQNVVGALTAVALLEGDVLNAAAALRNFSALKGRGARFTANGVAVIDESYNANPASMAAALALLGDASGRKIAVLGDMLEMGAGGIAHHAGLAQPIAANNVDLVFASGAQMKALWDALPVKTRGAYAETSAALLPQLLAQLAPGDTVLVKGSNGARMSLIIEALKEKGA